MLAAPHAHPAVVASEITVPCNARSHIRTGPGTTHVRLVVLIAAIAKKTLHHAPLSLFRAINATMPITRSIAAAIQRTASAAGCQCTIKAKMTRPAVKVNGHPGQDKSLKTRLVMIPRASATVV